MTGPSKTKPVDVDTFVLRINKRIISLMMDWFSTVRLQVIGDLDSDNKAYFATLVACCKGASLSPRTPGWPAGGAFLVPSCLSFPVS